MTTKRPGDVLAGRYRLDDLLSETGQGRFWRGHDQVLSRAVAIHVIDADDERAVRLMDAARASAQVVDPRLLRVLDIENDGQLCYVVNEWGQGTSLDHLVAREGPLPPRRAAWIVDEVATALQNAHDHGVAHGRLNPENVLIDTTGSVRLIGFAVEAALYGLGPDRIGIDVVDLAGLLHFTLTGKWPGLSESGVPRAPREQHGAEYRVLRPRQIRAGVPRVLDDVVDEVLNRPHGRHAGPSTAHDVHELLAAFVGDPTGLSDELAARPEMTVVGQRPRPVPAAPDAAQTPGTADAAADTADTADTKRPSEAAQEPEAAGPPETPAPEPQPTVAGLPVFDTDEQTGTADRDPAASPSEWFTPRDDVPAPPPPLEPPPERPLFAPDPVDGTPARRARAAAVPVSAPESGTDSSSYWPFDATPSEPPVPGRRWLRLALVLGVLLALVVAVVVATQLGDGDGDDGARDTGSSPSVSASPRPVPRPVTGTTAADFDPFGTPPAENSDLAPRAVDGDPSTSWRTSTYRQDLGPGGIKSGVGLVVDLQRVRRVTAVDLTFARAGTGVSLYVSASSPRTADDLRSPAATVTAGVKGRVPVEPAATGRFVTVWFTSLPRVTGGFRTELAEVAVVGTAV